MSQLKQSVVAGIYARLNGKRFTEYDFDVVLPESGGTLLEITLIANTLYSFKVSEELEILGAIAGQKGRTPISTECPGSIKSVEKNSHRSLDEAFDRIYNWLENVYEDLKTRTVGMKEIEELRRQLEAHIASHSFGPDEYFYDEELVRVEERLEGLMRSFEQLEKEHRISANQLEQLRQEVDQLKESAREVPKGIWASLAKSRIVLITKQIATSAEGRKLMFEAAKKLLLGGAPEA